MKDKRLLLPITILSLLLGWFLGFLRLPLIEKNFSFLLGFLSCLVFILLIALIKMLLKPKKQQFASLPKRESRNAGFFSKFWTLSILLILTAGIAGHFLIIKQQNVFESQKRSLQKVVSYQTELLESFKQSQIAASISNLVQNIDNTLKLSSGNCLSDTLIDRIVALNYSIKPYNYIEGDSLSVIKLSPERGHLLLHLAAMKLDSSSFAEIKQKTSFASADLEAADLRSVDLRGINLNGANLKDAKLTAANLDGADLKNACLWGANLQEASIHNANLKRADLKWSNLDGANFTGSLMDGIDLSNATLRNATLSGNTVQWAVLKGAMFNEATIAGADFFGSDLSQANFSGARLTGSNLRRVLLTNAIFNNADLSDMTVEEDDWFSKIIEWHISGAQKIKENYSIVSDTSGRTNYMLKKKSSPNHTIR